MAKQYMNNKKTKKIGGGNNTITNSPIPINSPIPSNPVITANALSTNPVIANSITRSANMLIYNPETRRIKNEKRRERNTKKKYDTVIYFYDIVEKPTSDEEMLGGLEILNSLRLAVKKKLKKGTKRVKLVTLIDNTTDDNKDIEFIVKFINETKNNVNNSNSNNSNPNISNVKIRTKLKIPALKYIKEDISIILNKDGNMNLDFITSGFAKIIMLFMPKHVSMYENITRAIIKEHYRNIMKNLRPFIIKVYNNPYYMKELLLKIFNKEHLELFKQKIKSKDIVFKTQGKYVDFTNENEMKQKINLIVTELLSIFLSIMTKIKIEEEAENKIPPSNPVQYTKLNITDIIIFFNIITSTFNNLFPIQQKTNENGNKNEKRI
jgi:hypothetical protein